MEEQYTNSGAIHSANFLPWLGTFDKMNRVEKFIFFDVAQYTRGKSWGSRVKILLNGTEHWLTMPIKKSGTGFQKEFEVEMLEPAYNWKKILSTITQAYKKANHYPETIEFLESFDIASYNDRLIDFSADFCMKTMRKLGNQQVQFVRAKENAQLLASTNLKTELIVEVCLAYGIKNYLSGEGCLDFLDPVQFTENNNIAIAFQGFKHPVYQQVNSKEFVPGLSIVDALMNCGFAGVGEMLNVKKLNSGLND
ncbi:MAG: WbqC family protein [Bacteroidia bacterium]|nr:WbqC family protein [Bacteroidia bacterium]